MIFLLGRYENEATEFYEEYLNNENSMHKPLKKMSKLTENLLHGIDYDYVMKKRTENFTYLHMLLATRNKLKLNVPKGAFMYPFYIEEAIKIREQIRKELIYIPILWPNVLSSCKTTDMEYKFAQNILPLPIDQRYGIDELNIIIKKILERI